MSVAINQLEQLFKLKIRALKSCEWDGQCLLTVRGEDHGVTYMFVKFYIMLL